MILLLDVLAVITLASVAWFAKNTETSGSGMLINADSARNYELASAGDWGHFSRDGYAGALALQREAGDRKALSGETSVYATSAEKPAIEWMMRPDSHLQNEYLSGVAEEYYPKLQPGTAGAVSFYILPPDSAEDAVDLQLALRLIPYTRSEGEHPYEAMSEESPAAKLLKGHILFFREFSEETGYSGWIPDGVFTVSVEADTPKEVTLYWIWPLYYGNLSGDSPPRVCADPAEQASLLADMQAQPLKYFAFTDPGEAESFSLAEGSPAYPNANAYHSANYNRADEQIGINIPYVVAEISID